MTNRAPFNPANPIGQCTPHFAWDELLCRCGCAAPLSIIRNLEALAKDLERIREHVGPLDVTSGYRCPTRNAAEGGAKQSIHMQGSAADLFSRSGSKTRLHKTIETLIETGAIAEGGLGIYPNKTIVHYDQRGYRARWYR